MSKFFEDWFSSYRGAGVIGTVVAVGVLLALGTLFLMAFGEDDRGKGKTIERILSEQSKEIEHLSNAVHHVNQQMIAQNQNHEISRECDRLVRRLADRASQCTELEQQFHQFLHEIELLNNEKIEYINAYRSYIRKNEIGKNYPALMTKSGRLYRRVVIKKVDDLRVAITHESGGGTIKWNDLPEEMFHRLLFSEELAVAQSKKESHAASHFASEFQESEVKSSLMLLESSMSDAKSAFESKRALVSQCSSKISEAGQQISRLQKLIHSESQKEGLRQTPRYRSQIAECERVIADEKRRLADFSLLEQQYLQNMSEMNARADALRKKLAK